MVLLFIGLLPVLIALGLILYARWNYGKLEKLGIPVVKPHFLLGSSHDMHTKINHLEDYERMKKHGKVFGVSRVYNIQLKFVNNSI